MVLAGVYDGERAPEHSLAELDFLARSAGAAVVAVFPQPRPAPDPATFLGKGKVEEIKRRVGELGAQALIIDGELSPVQLRNLEDRLNVKVIDRTQLILDIFAQRAATREGALQVELAQLRYNLPRLIGFGKTMSRLAGGIGTRGPGETRLEADRRRIRDRIARLEEEIDRIRVQRGVQRGRRRRSRIPVVALVGYTNAGKSTLLNVLAGADAPAADMLFATLDPTTRRLPLGDGREALLTDTVGFIRELPTHLIAAFRATLEEVTLADLLLHVIDASHPRMEAQAAAVHEILADLECAEIPALTVLNKVDLVAPEKLENLRLRRPRAVTVSARRGLGLDALMRGIAEHLGRDMVRVLIELDAADGELQARLHREAVVEQSEVRDGRLRFTVRIERDRLPRWRDNTLPAD